MTHEQYPIERQRSHVAGGSSPYASMALGFLLLVVTNATTMAIPQLVRRAIDDIKAAADSGAVDAKALRDLALFMVAFAVAGSVFRMLSRIHIFYTARDVEMDLRNQFYTHLTRMPASLSAERHQLLVRRRDNHGDDAEAVPHRAHCLTSMSNVLLASSLLGTRHPRQATRAVR